MPGTAISGSDRLTCSCPSLICCRPTRSIDIGRSALASATRVAVTTIGSRLKPGAAAPLPSLSASATAHPSVRPAPRAAIDIGADGNFIAAQLIRADPGAQVVLRHAIDARLL